MAEFLTTTGTSHHIENIIIEASSSLTLVSPYLQLSKTLLERLKDASDRNVMIKIVYGKDDLKPTEKAALTVLKNLELFYFNNLHAKCYFNEEKMVITSMNMYEFSEKTNREMGILIDSSIDKTIYEKASKEVVSILQSSERKYLQKVDSIKKVNTQKNNYVRPNPGFCIRCEEKVPYNPQSPYCNNCYQSWSHWENYHYEEKVCHRCGQDENSTMAKPQCYNCFETSRM